MKRGRQDRRSRATDPMLGACTSEVILIDTVCVFIYKFCSCSA